MLVCAARGLTLGLAIALAASAAGAGACRPGARLGGSVESAASAGTAADFELTWKLDPAPARVGPATLVVTLREKGGELVRGAAVRVEGHMTHAGMAPVLARASEGAPGEYGASLQLSMAGDWVLLVHAETADGRRLERRIDQIRVRPAP